MPLYPRQNLRFRFASEDTAANVQKLMDLYDTLDGLMDNLREAVHGAVSDDLLVPLVEKSRTIRALPGKAQEVADAFEKFLDAYDVGD